MKLSIVTDMSLLSLKTYPTMFPDKGNKPHTLQRNLPRTIDAFGRATFLVAPWLRLQMDYNKRTFELCDKTTHEGGVIILIRLAQPWTFL
jgi:hypothetical protein